MSKINLIPLTLRFASAAVVGIMSNITLAGGVGAAFADSGISIEALSEVQSEGNFEYVVAGDGAATIIGLMDAEVENVVIPDKIGDYVVTSIGGDCFYNNKYIKTVSLPNSVVSIGKDAFCLSSLQSIGLPTDLESIGEQCFYGCSKLAEISLPSSLDSIPARAFYGCDSLTSVVIPEGVETIGASAFFSCDSLKSISLPSSLLSIDGQAFRYCVSLESVVIPSGVQTVDYGAFMDCDSLVSVSLPASVVEFGNGAFAEMSYGSSVSVQTYYQYDLLKLGDYVTPERTDVVFEIGYPITATSVTLDRDEIQLSPGGSAQLNVSVTPTEASGSPVKWSTDDSTVAVVDADGIVKAMSTGETTVRATVDDITATCKVVVNPSYTVGQYDDPLKLKVTTVYGAPTWTVSDTSVIQITSTGILAESDPSGTYTYYTADITPRSVGTAKVECRVGIRQIGAWTIQVIPSQKASIADAVITGLRTEYELVEGGVTPKPVVRLNGEILEEGADYSLSYMNNTEAGIATVVVTGKGKYEGTCSAEFTIVEGLQDISGAVISGIDSSYEYGGRPLMPQPVVTLKDVVLENGVDYTLDYFNNNGAGVATIRVTGVGKYTGEITCTFQIVQRPLPEFDDVSTGDWYYDSVMKVCLNKYMGGYGGSSVFGSMDSIKRGDVAVVLANMANVETSDVAEPAGFIDVGRNTYYYGAISWARQMGIVSGDSGTNVFRPEDSISRQELAKMLWAYANIMGMDTGVDTDAVLSGYGDESTVALWAREYVAWAVQYGVMGQGSPLRASDPITRAEVATMIVRLQPEPVES